jgi:hypothetical protein
VTDETPSVPRRARLTLVLAHLLAALLAALGAFAALTWLAAEGSLDPRVVWLGVAFVSAPIVAALAWSVVARWDDRVELWADRLVRWERGRSEMFLLPEVARFDARLSTLRGGVDLETPVGLRVVMTDGRVLAVDDLPLRRARPLMQLVGGVLLERWYATLRRGGGVVCADAPPFPWALVTLVGLLAGSMGFMLFHRGGDATLSVLRAGLLLLSTGGITRRALRTWWAARRTGGVEMSVSGIVALRDVAKGAAAESAGSPYRATSAASRPWTPWSVVGEVYIDGFGLWVHCANRPEPLALSSRAENFFVVNEFIAAMRSARMSKAPPQD